MQRPDDRAAPEALVEAARDGLGVRVDLDDGAEAGPGVVELRDASQIRLRDAQRGHSARRELGTQRDGIERDDVGVGQLGLRAGPQAERSGGRHVIKISFRYGMRAGPEGGGGK